MKVIVGLGNPGPKYEDTRHNIGFKVIDELEKKIEVPLNQAKFKGQYGVGTINGEKVFLLKPLTYMNLSGESVKPLLDYFKIPVEDIVVIYDDLDLPAGKVRLREKGSHGGHNGIKSLIAHLGTAEFKRIRVGIDRPEPGVKVPDYVLGTFKPDEKEAIGEAVEKSVKAVQSWLQSGNFKQAMNEYN
ncbi:aminoacyl-tRNA hydrolase [Anaerobacillus sp. MEB173]|uniref:aminoacyl-tRNA hydrolase n=1 Tax=Anaerobacillus sp. MEB173 TaxID=3383345 RepID=UPI003F90FCAE